MFEKAEIVISKIEVKDIITESPIIGPPCGNNAGEDCIILGDI